MQMLVSNMKLALLGCWAWGSVAGQPMVFLHARDLFEKGLAEQGVRRQAEVQFIIIIIIITILIVITIAIKKRGTMITTIVGIVIMISIVILKGRATREALKKDAKLLEVVERPLEEVFGPWLRGIRGVAAVEMGIVKRWQEAESQSPYTPFVGLISAPQGAADVASLCVFMQQVHQAYPVTGAVATAAAALLPSILQAEVRGAVRIEHPSGVMAVEAAVGEGPTLLRAAMRRSARCLMDGQAAMIDDIHIALYGYNMLFWL